MTSEPVFFAHVFNSPWIGTPLVRFINYDDPNTTPGEFTPSLDNFSPSKWKLIFADSATLYPNGGYDIGGQTEWVNGKLWTSLRRIAYNAAVSHVVEAIVDPTAGLATVKMILELPPDAFPDENVYREKIWSRTNEFTATGATGIDIATSLVTQINALSPYKDFVVADNAGGTSNAITIIGKVALKGKSFKVSGATGSGLGFFTSITVTTQGEQEINGKDEINRYVQQAARNARTLLHGHSPSTSISQPAISGVQYDRIEIVYQNSQEFEVSPSITRNPVTIRIYWDPNNLAFATSMTDLWNELLALAEQYPNGPLVNG